MVVSVVQKKRVEWCHGTRKSGSYCIVYMTTTPSLMYSPVHIILFFQVHKHNTSTMPFH